MDNRIYLINLYDYYGDLLTPKQQSSFEDYYFNNLTLSEISENNDVSRNAIHKQLKDAEQSLVYYEKVLKLYEKNSKIRNLIKDLDSKLKEKIEHLL